MHTLPEFLYEVTLKDLMPNETVYVVPWCIEVDMSGKMYIDIDFSFHHSRGGTAQAKVKKGSYGFEVIIKQDIFYKWRPKLLSDIPTSYVPCTMTIE